MVCVRRCRLRCSKRANMRWQVAQTCGRGLPGSLEWSLRAVLLLMFVLDTRLAFMSASYGVEVGWQGRGRICQAVCSQQRCRGGAAGLVISGIADDRDGRDSASRGPCADSDIFVARCCVCRWQKRAGLPFCETGTAGASKGRARRQRGTVMRAGKGVVHTRAMQAPRQTRQVQTPHSHLFLADKLPS